MQSIRRHTARWASLALAVTLAPASAGLVLVGPAGAQTAEDQAPAALSTASVKATDGLPSAAGAARSRIAELDLSVLDGLTKGDQVSLPLFSDVTAVAQVTSTSTTDTYRSWSGQVIGGGAFNLVRVGDVRKLHVSTSEGAFEVSQGNGDVARVVEVAPEAEPKGDDQVDAPGGPSARKAASPLPWLTGNPGSAAADAAAASDTPDAIDQLVAYTPAAAAEAGGEAQIQAAIALAIEQTNTAMANSGVGSRVTLVGTVQTAASDSTVDASTVLRQLTVADGVYDEALTTREATHADQVSLIVGTLTGACGIGWLGGGPDRAFTVTRLSCATSQYSFAHEFGHNMTAEHDRGAARSNDKPYAAGLINATGKWATVLAYPSSCQTAGFTCTRVLHFSNPAVAYGGAPTGIADSADNARAMNEYASAMAVNRLRQIYPGTVSVKGKARIGKKLRATGAGWSLPAGSRAVSQWYVNGKPKGKGQTFKVTKRHVGKKISVIVTVSAPYYAPVSVGSPSKKVKGKRIRFVRARLSGLPKAGRKLAVSVKYPRIGKAKVKYQWYKGKKKIKGAKGRTYKVRKKDRGKKISCKVTVRKGGYEPRTARTRKVKIKKR